MTFQVPQWLNDPEFIQLQENGLEKLTYFSNHPQKGGPFYLNGRGIGGSVTPEECTDEWLAASLTSFENINREDLKKDFFAPVFWEIDLYGVHYVDKLFGVEVTKSKDLWWSKGLNIEVGELQPVDFDQNPLWIFTKQLYEKMVSIDMKLPFLSTQVLGSPIVGLFNLHKEKLLYAFYDNPEGVRHDLRVLTDALCYMHRWFQRNIPRERFTPVCCGGRIQPRGRGQMCGCTTQLVSKEIYDDFIYPFDCEVLSLYPEGGMYHLCGSHTQHISTWSQCKQLKAFQLNDRATDDLEYYVAGLREDQILYVNPTEKTTAEKAIALTGGKRLIVVP